MGTNVFIFFFVCGLAEFVEVVTDKVAGEFDTEGDGLGSVVIVGWDVAEEEGAADKGVLD